MSKPLLICIKQINCHTARQLLCHGLQTCDYSVNTDVRIKIKTCCQQYRNLACNSLKLLQN